MSIVELQKLVPAPASPVEVGTLAQWRAIEAKLGAKLPHDYRAFIFAYGSGLFAGLYRVYNPFAANPETALLPSIERICGSWREWGREWQPFPLAIFPEPWGLLPWGNDVKGNDYYWLTKGPPGRWVVVEDNHKGQGIRIHSYSMTGFLAGILQRKIRLPASGYPRKRDYKFKPSPPSV
jgi:hypothetical protein